MKYYVKCPDGTRWKVKEAYSLKHACDAIFQAKVTGSVGFKDTQMRVIPGLSFYDWPVTVLADVIQVNSDNTERQPYTEAY